MRDWLRWAVTRFGEAKLAFGHGMPSAWDEAAYLVMHALSLPLDRLEAFLEAKLTQAERQRVGDLLTRRIDQRVVAGLQGFACFGIDNREHRAVLAA